MDDFAPFESPKLLVEDAKTSLSEFGRACDTFLENCTYDTIRYIDPKSREHVVKLRLHHRIPRKVQLPAHHILNDLRHALDQAMCDGAMALGRPNAKGVYFPAGKTPADFARQIADKCKRVDHRLVDFVEDLKAHEGGDELLYTLTKLAGPNKHRRIIRVSLNHTGLSLLSTSNAYIPHSDLRPLPFDRWNELRNELEFMRFGRGMQGQIDAIPTFRMVLGDGQGPLSESPQTVLNAMATKVENIIRGIEAETT
jgi:hypothetical protein